MGGLSISKLCERSRLAVGLFACRPLSLLIRALVLASIEKQNGQHPQGEEADGKMGHIAQIRAHKDRE